MKASDLKQIIREESPSKIQERLHRTVQDINQHDMISLKSILKEVLLYEKTIKIPQEELNRSGKLYNYIRNNLTNLKSKSPQSYENPYLDPKYTNYFKLTDLKKRNIKINVGFYNDDQDLGYMRMNAVEGIMLINLAKFKQGDKNSFEEDVYHELVHAVDPKVQDPDIWGGIASKGARVGGSTFKRSLDKGNPGTIKSEFEKNWEKYLKSPWEFDAFTAPLIDKIVPHIRDVPSYKNILIKLLSDLMTKSVEEVVNNTEYEKMPWFFTKRKWTTKNWEDVWTEYVRELEKMKIWASKPTLYKRFVKRLTTEL